MPHWVVEKITDALNERSKAIKGSRILVLGLAYKKNIDDTRESPAVEIMDLLQAKGAHIDYSDPHVPVFPRKRDYHFDLQSVTLTPESIASYDCLVLATDYVDLTTRSCCSTPARSWIHVDGWVWVR
ncbi:MAG: UDP binding domain-containing protein [Paenacidovorax caeni]